MLNSAWNSQKLGLYVPKILEMHFNDETFACSAELPSQKNVGTNFRESSHVDCKFFSDVFYVNVQLITDWHARLG
jgi:hypothetical protein